ncbi:hypothetical protein CBR_g30640 [Chara braunii]|uniref:Uncharacterized protein n=1 Tax=Chara braunii TaxID=69332 RepID=A0A388LDI9_CHABU|nr:hypothetical protein CBR_g30640 [Chara braunii]|eukprot:GBG80273.1 hypothetical protein CBR_g30640 [Chara braunii]
MLLSVGSKEGREIVTGRPSSLHVSNKIWRMGQQFLTFVETGRSHVSMSASLWVLTFDMQFHFLGDICRRAAWHTMAGGGGGEEGRGGRRTRGDEEGGRGRLMSTEQDTWALPGRSARLAVRSHTVILPQPKYQQQGRSRRTAPAPSSTNAAAAVPVTTGVLPACPVQGDHGTAEADPTGRDRRNAASTESLIQNESQWTALLQGMIFVPTDEQADPTPAEAERSNLANLMLGMTRAVMWNNTMQIAHAQTGWQLRQTQQRESATWTAAIRTSTQHQQQQQQLLASTITRVNSIEAKPSAAPGCTTDIAKQLGERIDHVVTIIGDLGDFTSPASISSTLATIKTDITKLQSRPEVAAKTYKMPCFNIGKFDDYNKTDALAWWHSFITEAACHHVPDHHSFITEAACHHVPDHLMMTTLYLQLIVGVLALMNHLTTNLGTTIVDLHTHITWE